MAPKEKSKGQIEYEVAINEYFAEKTKSEDGKDKAKHPFMRTEPDLIMLAIDTHYFTPNEGKVFLWIYRHTFGFQQMTTEYNVSRISQSTGITRASIIKCINVLEAKGWLDIVYLGTKRFISMNFFTVVNQMNRLIEERKAVKTLDEKQVETERKVKQADTRTKIQKAHQKKKERDQEAWERDHEYKILQNEGAIPKIKKSGKGQ